MSAAEDREGLQAYILQLMKMPAFVYFVREEIIKIMIFYA